MRMSKPDEDNIFQMGAEAILSFLEKEKFQNKLVEKLNENIDIPFINEKTEEKIISALCETVVSALRESLKKDKK